MQALWRNRRGFSTFRNFLEGLTGGRQLYKKNKPPQHERREDVRSRFGLQWVDAYSWMEEGVGAEAVRRAVEAERSYHDSTLAGDKRLNELADLLYDEFTKGVPEGAGEDLATEVIGPFEYVTAHDAESELPRLLRRAAGSTGDFVTVLDLNDHAEDCGGRCDVRGVRVSPDHSHVAFVSDMGQGAERYAAVIRPVGAGGAGGAGGEADEAELDEIIPGVGSVEWMSDSARLLYTSVDPRGGRPYQVRCHRLGGAIESDAVLMTESNERRAVQLTQTRDRRFVLANSNSKLSSEVFLIDTSAEEPRPWLLERGRKGLEYFVEHKSLPDSHEVLFILSNLQQPMGDYGLFALDLPPPPPPAASSSTLTASRVPDATPPSSPSPPVAPVAPTAASGPSQGTETSLQQRETSAEASAGAASPATPSPPSPPSPPEYVSPFGPLTEGGTAPLWRRLVQPRPGVHVTDLEVLHGHLALVESRGLKPQVSLLDLKEVSQGSQWAASPTAVAVLDAPLKELFFPPWACHVEVTHASAAAAVDPSLLHCTAESPYIPPQPVHVDTALGTVLYKETEDVLKASDKYGHRVDWVVGQGGARVPLSLFYKKIKENKEGGEAPIPGVGGRGGARVLMEVYGAYGLPLRPTYSPVNLSLLDRGWVLAYAHVRGGGELGRSWHAGGRLAKRGVALSDFLACIDHVVERGLAPPGGLALKGYSAAGVLLGPAAILRSQLLGAVIAHRPFFDVLTCMTDATLDLTAQDYEEWGDPMVGEELESLLSSCPYHNLDPHLASVPVPPAPSAGLPPTRITAATSDRRVPFWGPLKYVARLRHAAAARGIRAENVFLDFGEGDGGGHFGPQGRHSGPLDDLKDAAFLLRHMG